MPNKNISETRKPEGMPSAEWDRLRVSLSAAEMKARGYVHDTVIECCKGDGTGCPDHDPDAVMKRSIEAKSLQGALTATDRTNHADAEIRLKAKGLL